MTLKKQSLILIIFVFLIKEILVFNEEFLIFLSFIFFVYIFSKFIKRHIYLELLNQNLDIQKDFILYDKSQQNLNLHLYNYYFFQKTVLLDLLVIIYFINSIVRLLIQKYSILLKKLVYSLIESKFKKLIISEKKLKQNEQKSIVFYILKRIFNVFKINPFKSRTHFLSQSINIFLNI